MEKTPIPQTVSTITESRPTEVRHIPIRIVGGIGVAIFGIVFLFTALYIFVQARDRAFIALFVIGLFDRDQATAINMMYFVSAAFAMGGLVTFACSGAIFYFLHQDSREFANGIYR